MWFFMYACYALSLCSLVLFGLTGLTGYGWISIGQLGHFNLALVTIIVYLFTQTLVMFYFVGTGVSIKEYSQEKKLKPDYYNQITALKSKIYPPAMTSIFLVSVTFILGGAVHTRVLPSWVHGVLFWIALLHFAKCLIRYHFCFKENTEIMLQTFDVQRETDPANNP